MHRRREGEADLCDAYDGLVGHGESITSSRVQKSTRVFIGMCWLFVDGEVGGWAEESERT